LRYFSLLRFIVISGLFWSNPTKDGRSTHLISRHSILDQQGDPAVQVSDVPFQYKVLFGLSGYPGFEISQAPLSC
jgi:hypothetical protein